MAAPGRAEETCGPGAGTVCVRLPAKPINLVFVRKPGGRVKQKKRPANEEACIVKQFLTMQASSISIVYCSPCELSSV